MPAASSENRSGSHSETALHRIPPPTATPAGLRDLAAGYSDDTEYDAAWGLAQIDAATAYGRIACELSSVFGRGVMDLGAATAPVGSTSIALGSRVAEGGAPARSSGIVSGSAMGDALGRALAGRRIAVFETHGAPFWTDAAGFAADAAPPDPVERLWGWLGGMDGAGASRSAAREDGPVLAILAGPAENGLEVGPHEPHGAHLGLASQPMAAGVRIGNTVLSAFSSTVGDGDPGAHALDADTHGVALAWNATDGRTGFRAGRIRETDTLFGAGAEGAFGTLSSGLSYVGGSRVFDAGGWRVGLAGEIGWAAPKAAGGVMAVAGASALSTAFSAEAARPLAGGTLRLLLVQPLRVESGRLELSLPMGRTPEGAVMRERVDVDLEPSGRQIDAGMDWTGAVAPGTVLRIGARLIREPGHVAGGNPEAAAFAGLRIRMYGPRDPRCGTRRAPAVLAASARMTVDQTKRHATPAPRSSELRACPRVRR